MALFVQQTIYEYATRVGQQAVVLVATPGKPNNIYKVFGAKPLEDVMKNLRSLVMDELETALAQQAPPRVQVIVFMIQKNTVYNAYNPKPERNSAIEVRILAHASFGYYFELN